MTNESWNDINTEGTDWYDNFINLCNNVYNQAFAQASEGQILESNGPKN